MSLSNSRNVYVAVIEQYGCFKLVHFSKRSGRRSSVGPEILAFVSHCSANFLPMLDCFTPNFKLKYEDSENLKVDHVDTIVFSLHQIKHWAFLFWDTWYKKAKKSERGNIVLKGLGRDSRSNPSNFVVF